MSGCGRFTVGGRALGKACGNYSRRALKFCEAVVITALMVTEKFFVPYSGKKPASVCVNGHRLVILAPDREVIERDLELLGADRVKQITVTTGDEHDKLLGSLARQVDGGVVIAPEGVDLRDILKNLEHELPWVH